MFTYPKILRKKDLKKIDKYSCDNRIKDAYLKYLTYYSFNEFVKFCEDHAGSDLEKLIFKFADLQLEKYEPNSLIWISHVLINFMIYFDVNLDYGEYYDAYASALQLAVLAIAVKMSVEKIPFNEVPFPELSENCFQKLFDKCPDFKFDLNKDCDLAYKSFNENFDFSSEEFYQKTRNHFEDKGY